MTNPLIHTSVPPSGSFKMHSCNKESHSAGSSGVYAIITHTSKKISDCNLKNLKANGLIK